MEGSHYRYGGRSFVRVTEVLKVLNKPAMVGWAAKTAGRLVLDDPATYNTPEKAAQGIYDTRNKAAGIGSVAHRFAENVSKGTPIDLEALPEELRGYGVALQGFMRMCAPKPLFVEASLYSETHGYAGTTDLIATLADGLVYDIDFKTARGVYDENKLQLAAYRGAEIIVPSLPDVPCPRCDATGKINDGRCGQCAGGGFIFDPVPMPGIDKAAVVLLGADGRWSIAEVDTPLEPFLHLLEVWRWLNNGGPR